MNDDLKILFWIILGVCAFCLFIYSIVKLSQSEQNKINENKHKNWNPKRYKSKNITSSNYNQNKKFKKTSQNNSNKFSEDEKKKKDDEMFLIAIWLFFFADDKK